LIASWVPPQVVRYRKCDDPGADPDEADVAAFVAIARRLASFAYDASNTRDCVTS